jgi:hypothetical protein
MLRCRIFLIGIFCLSIFASTISSYAGDEIEDLIDIAESKGKIIAIIKGEKTITYNLRPKEKVLWSGSRGHLGAFLTDLQFYVISASLNAWHALPLKLSESGKGMASLSPYIALLVTGDRATGFDSTSNRFIEVQLPLHDELFAVEAERYVAVVITSSRAYGLAVESSSFVEIILRQNETIEAIKLTFRKATVRTSDRLLSFEASGSTWKELRLY